MKKVLLIVFAIVIFFAGYYSYQQTDKGIPTRKITEAKKFCREHNLNMQTCVFVDFSKNRLCKRLQVYDLKQNKVLCSSLCPTGLSKNEFSNVPGSYLSSLGKYRITDMRYKMKIGYEGVVIQGMEKSNSNAEKRQILVHSYKWVNALQMFNPNLSWGCFVVDMETYKKIKSLKKPMLLWAYK